MRKQLRNPKRERHEAKACRVEIDEINRQVREHREEIQKLLARKKEIEEGHRKKRRPLSWDGDTPMTKLIYMSQFERLKIIFDEWQEYSTTTIVPKRSAHFEFDLAHKKIIVLALKDAWEGSIPLFKISQKQVLEYLSEHSNLGKADSLKKILYRNK